MKKLKVVALSAFFVIGTSAVFAQQQKTSSLKSASPTSVTPAASSQAGHSDEKLNLTDDQKAKIKSIKDANRAKMTELRKQMQTLRKNEKDQIMNVLTPEQKEIVAKKEQERKEMRKTRRMNNPQRMKSAQQMKQK